MRTATVTYNSPPGDHKVVQMGGVTFSDGESVEVNSYDNPHLLSNIAAAKEASERAEKEAADAKTKAEAARADHEKLSKTTDKEVVRPPAEGQKASLKAGMTEAIGRDFEKDRQANVAKRDAQAKNIGANEQGPGQSKPDAPPNKSKA
jgi:hypothetical protein